jgi:hypothetical protein
LSLQEKQYSADSERHGRHVVVSAGPGGRVNSYFLPSFGIIFVFYLSTPAEETKKVKFFSTSSLLTALICSLTMSARLGLEQEEKQAIKIKASRRGKGTVIENLRKGCKKSRPRYGEQRRVPSPSDLWKIIQRKIRRQDSAGSPPLSRDQGR